MAHHVLQNYWFRNWHSICAMSKKPSLSKQFQSGETPEKRKRGKTTVELDEEVTEEENVLSNVYVTPTPLPTSSIDSTTQTRQNTGMQ
jgi:hypothetical protein